MLNHNLVIYRSL